MVTGELNDRTSRIKGYETTQETRKDREAIKEESERTEISEKTEKGETVKKE